MAFFSIKQGHSIEAPIYVCKAWKTEDGTNISFPYTPSGDLVVYANNDTYASALYSFYNVDSVFYPYLCVTYSTAYKNSIGIHFAQSFRKVNEQCIELSNVQYENYANYNGELNDTDYTDLGVITALVMAKIPMLRSTSSYNVYGDDNALYTNFDTTLNEAPDLYRLDDDGIGGGEPGGGGDSMFTTSASGCIPEYEHGYATTELTNIFITSAVGTAG